MIIAVSTMIARAARLMSGVTNWLSEATKNRISLGLPSATSMPSRAAVPGPQGLDAQPGQVGRPAPLTCALAHLDVALTCLLIGLTMPPMELVPFSANGGGLALTLFGLALLAEDGLMALAAYLLTGTTLALVVIGLA